ncbi:MAG: haloalkane dehalogenase [Candidatus Angelobacter sp.]
MAQDQQPPSIDQLRAQVSQMLDTLPAQAPISAIVLFEVDPAKEGLFLQNADALTEATRRLPGCNVFAFNRAVKPGSVAAGIEYLIYEDWQARDLFRTQWDSQHLQAFQHSVGDLIVAPPDLRFYFGWHEYRTEASSMMGDAMPGQSTNQNSRSRLSSFFAFPYAASLFGMQQMANIFDPGSAARSLENLTHATEKELGSPLRAVFHLGNSVQKAAFDLAMGGFGGRNDGPDSESNWSATISSVMKQAVATASQPLTQTAENFTSTSGQPSAYSNQPGTNPPVTQNNQPGPTNAPAASGWGPMPYPVPVPDPPRGSAPNGSPEPTAAAPAIGEPDISPDYPFRPNYVGVLGSRMHYIEQGNGNPILLLHGNPSWSYIWRNIIPHLSPLGRCIAPDLIGFGRSDKPRIEYLWRDHARYLEAFIQALDLRDITLVLHDQGSSLGFHYAMHHQANVNAIAFFEAIPRPFPWNQFSTPEFRELFRRFRTGGEGGEGWQMIVDKNMFIEQLLPQAAGRPLSEKEMNFYREPFRTAQSRIPVWRFPRQTAIGGEPRDVWDATSKYSESLQRSEMPKLMLYATPGALLTQEHVMWCRQSINNLQSVFIGPGLHFLQESSPHRIGQEIASWYRNLHS